MNLMLGFLRGERVVAEKNALLRLTHLSPGWVRDIVGVIPLQNRLSLP